MHSASRLASMLIAGTLFGAAPTLALAGIVSIFAQNGNDGGGPFNTTEFSVTNLSAPGVRLTGFSLTIGDSQYNFDELYQSVELFTGGDGTQAASLLVGDRFQDGVVTDSFSYAFTNFDPGVTFRGQFDIDNDNGDFNADARLVLFNNGAAPNAVATFTFSDGSDFSYVLQDDAAADSYTITIPAPGAAVLGLISLLVGVRRKR